MIVTVEEYLKPLRKLLDEEDLHVYESFQALLNDKTSNEIKLSIWPQIIASLKSMSKKERLIYIEDVLTTTSIEYITSIKQARDDYKNHNVYSHKEVFSDDTL
jgi:hypothetical protein